MGIVMLKGMLLRIMVEESLFEEAFFFMLETTHSVPTQQRREGGYIPQLIVHLAWME